MLKKKTILIFLFLIISSGVFANEALTNTVSTNQGEALTPVLVLNLKEAVEIALEKNRDYLMAVQDIKIKQAAADSLYANFFPSLDFRSTLTALDPDMVEDSKSHLPPTMGGGTIQMVHSPQFNMGLTATWAIPGIPFFSDGAWGMANKAHDLALKDLKLAENKRDKTRDEVIAGVTKSFWQLKLAELVYELTKSNQDRLTAYLDVANRNFWEGRVSRYEQLRAQVQLANNQPELLKAENAVRLARVAFLQQLSLDLDTQVVTQGKFETGYVSITEDQALTLARENRSELKDTQLALEVAEIQKDLANYGVRPQLAAFANYNWELKKTGGLFSQKDRSLEGSWNAGLQLSIPLSELLNPASKSWESTEQYAQAIKRAQTLSANVESLIQLDIKQSFLRLDENKKTIASQKTALDLSTEGLRAARIAYNEGLIGNVELMDAELDFQRAQMMEYQAWFGYISAKIDLYQAMGVLFNELEKML